MTRLLGAILLAGLTAGVCAAQVRTQVTTNSVNDYYPAVSTDGQWIAWIGERNFQFEVFSMDTSSMTPKQLTTGGPATIPWSLAMSGNNGILAFISNGNIWTIPTTGGKATQVTSYSGTTKVNMNLTLSHDGNLVGYTTWDSSTKVYGFAVVNLLTKVVSPIAANTLAGARMSGCVSGDGTKVAYLALDKSNHDQVWIANPDGTGKKQISAITSGTGAFPALDHTATVCAFEHLMSGESEIYTLGTDGKNLTNVSQNTVGADVRAKLSADGDRVTWKSRWQLTNVGNDIWMAYPDGTGKRKITTFGGMTTGNPNDSHALNGDGTVIVFATRYNVGGGNPQADHEIYLWEDGLTQYGIARPGQAVILNIQDKTAASNPYLIRCAYSRSPGIPLPGSGTVPLTPDALFWTSGFVPTIFQNFNGILDQNGKGFGVVAIPNIPALSGLDFFAGAVSVSTAVKIYNPVKITVL